MTQDITAADHFCGAGGASIGLVAAGVVVTDAANHWPVACGVYSRNNPDTRVHCADLSATDPRRFPRTDLGWFSPECFPAGTLILTSRGLVPIENVVEGDEALTHFGRWRRVTGTTSRLAETIVVEGQGHPGLETTAEHPIYARGQEVCRTGRGAIGEAQWVAAEKLEGGRRWRWATPVGFDALPVPPVEREGPWQGRGMPLDDPDFWWLVGRWLGDGVVRLRSGQGGEVTICAGDHEAEDLWARLQRWQPSGPDRAGSGELRWRRRRTRTAWLFECGHQELAEWLVQHFGRLAHGKTLPAWALTMAKEYRRALLDGYVSADGHDDGKTIVVGTVSKSLAVGTRLLVESLGYRTSLGLYSENTNTIEGRRVNTRDRYVLRWWKNASQRSALYIDGCYGGHAWSLVKKVRPGRDLVEVFNISVEEDESYIADGIVVHNCRTFSQSAPPASGRMPELFDESPDSNVERSRVSMADVIRFTDHHRYDIVMVENVVEVTRKYPIDAWFAEMEKLGYDFQVLSVNSMVCWPTPQSRDRWYACFWRRGNRAPDYEIRPKSWCPACEAEVEAYQWFKRPPKGDPRKQCGKYRQQYLYRCSRCQGQALPFVWPALAALDLSIPCPRIGDRETPLAPATMRRIEAGLQRYGPMAVVQNAGHTYERPGYYRTWPMWRPLNAMTATNQFGLAVNTQQAGSPARYDAGRCTPFAGVLPTQTAQESLALVVPVDHGDSGPRVAPAEWPQRTQTGRAETGMVVVPMRTHNGPRHPAEPLAPLTTSHGGGHSIVELPFLVDGGKGEHPAQPTMGPGQAVTGWGSQFVVALRNHGEMRPGAEPAGAFTADGNHHGVLVRMNGDEADAQTMARPWDDPVMTVTGAANQAVVPFLTHYYGSSRPGYSGPHDPVPTQTSNDRNGLVDPVSIDPLECGFRMMEPHEAGAAMAFPSDYAVDGLSKRTRVRLYGQAVTPPVSAELSARAIESLTG